MGQMISLVVKSLFTRIPLNKTIEITLEQIYDLKEIKQIFQKSSSMINAITMDQGCSFFI